MTYKMTYQNGKTDREHRFVMEAIVGRKLTLDEIVHHIDGDKRNNNPDNLTIVTRREHAIIHAKDIIRSKPVIQKDNFGNVIKEWPSARQAANELGILSSNISACCNGRLKHTGGYSWEFVNTKQI